MFERLVKYKEIHGVRSIAHCKPCTYFIPLTISCLSVFKDCLVPKRYQEDPKLGTWVETQRVQYKKLQLNSETGEPITPNNRINPERLSRLESIGFAWSAKNLRKSKIAPSAHPNSKSSKAPPDAASSRAAARQRLNDMQWNDMYSRLLLYKSRYGVS